MELLKRAYQRAIQLWNGMPRNARSAFGIVTIIVCLGLLAWSQIPAWRGNTELFGTQVLTEDEINRMEAAFAAAGLTQWTRDGNRLKVPLRMRARYVAVLTEANALPEQAGDAFQAVYQTNSLLESRSVTDSKLRRASERSLAYTIRGLKGIQFADVKIEVLEKSGFPRQREMRAVASVKALAERTLDRHQVDTIRDIVAHGGGVATEHVVVVDLNASRSFRGDAPDGAPGSRLDDPYLARLRAHEELIRRRIEDLLVIYPGALVSVRVALPGENRSGDSGLFPTNPKRLTPTSASELAGEAPFEVVLNPRPEAGQPTLPPATLPPPTQAPVHPSPDATSSRFSPADQIPRARATILLPRSLFHQIWQQEQSSTAIVQYRLPDRRALAEVEARIIREVQDAVAPLLPVSPGESPSSLVTVSAFTPTPGTAPEPRELSQVAISWFFMHWQMISLPVLSAAALWLIHNLIRSAVRKTVQKKAVEKDNEFQPTLSLPVGGRRRGAEHSAPAEASEPDEANLCRELTAFIHKNPERAARVIAEWLDDAA